MNKNVLGIESQAITTYDFETSHTYIDTQTKHINMYYDGTSVQNWLQVLVSNYT